MWYPTRNVCVRTLAAEYKVVNAIEVTALTPLYNRHIWAGYFLVFLKYFEEIYLINSQTIPNGSKHLWYVVPPLRWAITELWGVVMLRMRPVL